MVTINLLPLTKRRCEWFTRRAVVAAVLLLSLLVGSLFAYNQYQIWSLEKQIAALRQQYELLRPTQETSQSIHSKQRIFEEKNSRLIKITAMRKPWKAILTHLGMITPPPIWLLDLSMTERNSVMLKGNAVTYADLAAFISLLEQDEFLTEPVLVNAVQDKKNSFTRFELSVRHKGK